MFIKPFFISFVAIGISYLVRLTLKTDTFIPDVGGLGAFVTVFGTLYGIMAAFVVFEVWGQFNKTSGLIDQEALAFERLYRLTLYFRDAKLSQLMKKTIENYIGLVVEDKFRKLASGKQHLESSRAFRKFARIIRDIKFNDDHDQVIFDHIVDHYGHLSEIRTERITHSLMRLPYLLKFFLYSTSVVAIITFILMPFTNMYYGFFVNGTITFVISMIILLVEDLDNPFNGNWKITSEPFERSLRHIEEDY
jgi:hypothetical protein